MDLNIVEMVSETKKRGQTDAEGVENEKLTTRDFGCEIELPG